MRSIERVENKLFAVLLWPHWRIQEGFVFPLNSTSSSVLLHLYGYNLPFFFPLFWPAKILVHCAVGVSRSASLVLAYLMINHHLPLIEAIKTVKEHRWISPNRGFLKHLRNLDVQLRQKKGCWKGKSLCIQIFSLHNQCAYNTSHDQCILKELRVMEPIKEKKKINRTANGSILVAQFLVDEHCQHQPRKYHMLQSSCAQRGTTKWLPWSS